MLAPAHVSTPSRGRHNGRLLDRFDPYLVDECTFTREEIVAARAAVRPAA